jgi:hypothetical protein
VLALTGAFSKKKKKKRNPSSHLPAHKFFPDPKKKPHPLYRLMQGFFLFGGDIYFVFYPFRSENGKDIYAANFSLHDADNIFEKKLNTPGDLCELGKKTAKECWTRREQWGNFLPLRRLEASESWATEGTSTNRRKSVSQSEAV